ncbi:MAG TPA: ClpXP protease specificity-enhancing factor [Steroidobacteraceae bacterium]|jgi:stringent starvation protein B|nr:ClpXP protease specificity-enhancing factor [Steroidobacteraceae bacterium]
MLGKGGGGVSRRPYLLRAMHEWITDSGHTPHVIVDATRAGVEVPGAYIKDGKIVLNLSTSATQRLQLKNDWIEFDARFAGVVHHVRVPMHAVLGVYARETGEGMVFSETEKEPTPPEPPNQPDKAPLTPTEGRRAKLTVVK